MRITVECCGAAQRWCGAAMVSLDLGEAATVADALTRLAERYPELEDWRDSLAVAIGDQIVAAGHSLKDGERMALIPPVSGG